MNDKTTGIFNTELGVVGQDVVATFSIDQEETNQAQTIDQICESLKSLAAESGSGAGFALLLAVAALHELESSYINCFAEPTE